MAELTNAPKPTRFPLIRKPESESPLLWLSLAAGSIAFHLILLLITLPLAVRLSAQQQSQEPTAIDLVELPPETAPSTLTEAPPAESRPEAAPASVPEATEPAAEPSPAPAQPEPPVEPDAPIFPPLSQTPLTPAPLPSNSPTPIPPSPSPRPREIPSPSPSPEPPDPEPSPSPEPSRPVAPSPAPPDPETDPAPQPNPEPDPDPADALPDLPAPPIENGSESGLDEPTSPSDSESELDLPDVAISDEVTPANWTANLLNVGTIPASEDPTDIPEQPAIPNGDSLTVTADPLTSSCDAEPEAYQFFGQPVELQVAIDETGQIFDKVQIRQSSGNSAYDDLAACLIREWEFTPAVSGGQPIASNLVIVITIGRS
jgi:TonB family protein